jgi:hypothetical protein
VVGERISLNLERVFEFCDCVEPHKHPLALYCCNLHELLR